MSPDTLKTIILAAPALLLSLSVHEFAHAWTATRLGDDTPRRQGRLTLNPLSHIDWFGTVIFPAIMLLASSGSSFFGWAKPVQFNPNNFSRKMSWRKGAAITAAAGPISNVLLAFFALLTVRVVSSLGLIGPGNDALGGAGTEDMLFRFLQIFVGLNVLLAVFNFLPLPPLDGSYLLPRSMDQAKVWLTRYSLIVFLFLFFLPFPGLGYPLGHLVMGPLIDTLNTLIFTLAYAGS